MGHFGEFLKATTCGQTVLPDRSFKNRTKIGGKCQNWKIQMRYFGWFDFQTMCATEKYCKKKEQNDF